MDKEIQPASYRKRKFQSIHDLLHSSTFAEPVDPDGDGDVAIVSIPDMNQQDGPRGQQSKPAAHPSIPGGALASQAALPASQTEHGSRGIDFPVADLDESPDHWATERETPDGHRHPVEGCVTDLCRSFEDIEPIVNQIINGSQDGEASVSVFASTDRHSNSDSLASSVAVALACRLEKPVILVDSDFENRRLTRVYGLELDPGISNYLFQSARSSQWLYRTDRDHVIFVPTGDCSFGPLETASLNTGLWLEKLNRQYLHVCVNAGDAHGVSLPLWSEYCDAAYLSVDRERSSQAIARSAVSRMRAMGTERLSCVVH
ncbi:MAG: hypothetical protein MK108_10835 [Mariniblastus sp.]|nr:hypothetical protein [Mariniblastus sp.]